MRDRASRVTGKGTEGLRSERPAPPAPSGSTHTTLLYKLFRVGRVPRRLLPALETEGLVLLDQGARGSIAYQRFRGPGRRFGRRREWFTGCVVLTRVRFVALAYGRRLVNVPLGDPRLAGIEVREHPSSTLLLAFDAGLFLPEQSGRVEVRLRTSHATELVRLLAARAAPAGSGRTAPR